MITQNNKNSHAAKLMIREILSLIHDDIATLTPESIQAYSSVLTIMQWFVLKNVSFSSLDDENADNEINKQIITLTLSILNYEEPSLEQVGATELFNKLLLLLNFFNSFAEDDYLEVRKLLTNMTEQFEYLINHKPHPELDKVCNKLLNTIPLVLDIFIRDHFILKFFSNDLDPIGSEMTFSEYERMYFHPESILAYLSEIYRDETEGVLDQFYCFTQLLKDLLIIKSNPQLESYPKLLSMMHEIAKNVSQFSEHLPIYRIFLTELHENITKEVSTLQSAMNYDAAKDCGLLRQFSLATNWVKVPKNCIVDDATSYHSPGLSK